MIIVLIIVTIISHVYTAERFAARARNFVQFIHSVVHRTHVGWEMATILNGYLRNVCRPPGRNCGSPMAFGMLRTQKRSSVSGATRNCRGLRGWVVW